MQYSNINVLQDDDVLFQDDNLDIDVIDMELNWNDTVPNDLQVNIHVDNVSDGLIYSLRNLGKVDIEYISKITDVSIDTVIEKLKGSIYQDPECWQNCYYKGFKTADEYLSGNLLKKLQKAEFGNLKFNNRFIDNVKALKAIMPQAVTSGEIYYTLSSPWIPKHIIQEFFNDEFLFRNDDKENLVYDDLTNEWKVVVTSNRINYTINFKFGTKRISAVKIFENLLNSKNIAIYDTLKVLDKAKRVLNQDETQLALNKAQELNNYFKTYLNRRGYLLDELVDTYNEKFAYNVSRTYNGDFLEIPNINPNVTLFKSQKDAIARIIFNNNTLLAYNVGAGKTYIMVAAGEELLRMSLSKKNLYVVPNNIVKQWENDYKYLYPNSNILVAKTTDFSPNKINTTLKTIKDGNYKAIIMAHSSFDNIVLSRTEEMASILNRIDALSKEKQTKYILGQINKLKEEYKKLEALGDDYTSFKELGITRLFIDESHNYKNIPLSTNRGYIKGINLDGSNKCEHLKSICNYINSQNDTGVILATGTPISNSISDIYSVQEYLQKGELKLLDINTFDDWLNMFTEEADEFEIDLDSSKYRAVKKLSKFHNLPELTSILSSVAAFYYDTDKTGLPKFNGYTDVKVSKSNELKAYIEELSNRLELIRAHQVNAKDDNLLKITTDGRKAALDLRLIDENLYKGYSDNKVIACSLQVVNTYLKTKSFKGTQLVFCDTSVPGKSFNIYDELKRSLINYGIPENEIVYIHDATTDKKRDELFKAMNEGKVRILIGSTMKLGTGVNVQDKLCAIHHLDIPWRPSDMVQREGRILRIGNKCDEVFIYRYITEGSFDAYSWQILENKQKFIGELLNNSLNERTKEDIQDSVLNYGEIKALAIGNPKLQEHIKLKNKIAKTRMLQKKYNDTRSLYKRELLEIPNQVSNLNIKINQINNDIEFLKSSQTTYSKDEKQRIRKLIWDTLMDNLGNDNELDIITYNGFKIKAPANLIANSLYLIIECNNRYVIELGSSELGIITRIDNLLEKLPTILNENIDKRDKLIIKQESITKELETEIDYASLIIDLNKELEILEKELNINE